MTKLAIFMPSLDGGGAERVTILLLNELSRRGHDIDLLVANGKGVYRQQVHPSINIIDFDKNRVASCLLPLVRYLRVVQPEALLSVMNYTNVIAILAKKLAGVKSRLVLTEHNNAEQALKNAVSIRYKIVNVLTRWLYKSADEIVCVSEGVAESIYKTVGVPKSKLSVIYNPVVHPGINLLAAQSLSHPFIPENGELFMIAVGRLTAQKNFPNLIKAFRLVRNSVPAKLVILGEGEERQSLSELLESLELEEHVLMPGFVDNPYAWMRLADVFVLSSSWEGLPTVLIEALACGTKVVSTDCPSGPMEILENGLWGELVACDNAEALAAGILKAYANHNTPNIGERLKLFSMEYAADRYTEALKI